MGSSAPAYATELVRGLKEANVQIATALPESLLQAVYGLLLKDQSIRFVPVASEWDCPGIVCGAYLGGKRAVMIFENSGIRQACEPIARLGRLGLPMVMIMPYRGDLGEPNWWGHTHADTMDGILRALRIPYWVIRDLDDIAPAIGKAFPHADSGQRPVALVLAGECMEERG